MKRRDFVFSSISFSLGAAGLKGSAQNLSDINRLIAPLPTTEHLANHDHSDTKQPNIIFIMSDQHRGDTIGCMGNKSVITPNIDRLASEGTLFVSGYTASPSSTPARAGLLTGLSPWHHGMLGYGKVAEKYKYEMPQMMRNLGYYCFGIGKMHWSPQNALHGFHATLIDESGRVESPNFISDYRKWFQLNAPGENPDKTGIGWNDHGAGTYKLDERLHPTAWTGETACEFIRNYDNQRPLFLKVSFARPHSPYDPPKRYLDLYNNVAIPKPSIGDWCGKYAERKTPEQVAKDVAFANLGDEYAVCSRRHYYANVTFIDDQVGKIIKTLKERGMYDNSIICYTADHGDMLGDHYHWRKTYAYEGSTKIPFIIKWPSSMKINNKRIDKPVELRDFLPTFLTLAGGQIPSDMDGKSLLPLVNEPNPQWRQYIDLEHATCYSPDNYWCALTDGKIKYIWFFHSGNEQLFDLQKDPHELKNLSADKNYAKRLAEMRTAMIEHLKERGDEFVKDGKLVIREKTMLYSPNYPKNA